MQVSKIQQRISMLQECMNNTMQSQESFRTDASLYTEEDHFDEEAFAASLKKKKFIER